MLWLFIPNYRAISDRRKKFQFQVTGGIIGGISGLIIGVFGPAVFFENISGIVLILIGFLCLPVGAFFGFMIGRGILEKQANSL